MTIHDIIDALLLAAVLAAWQQSGRVQLGWAVVGLVLTHVIGRHIIATFDEPLMPLGVGFTGIAAAYLLSPMLTVYGRIVGTVFAVMGSACFVSVMAGHNPSAGQGLALNVWNVLSTGLHVAAFTILIGVHRHGRILARAARPHH
jgi:hypothetical protein